MQKLLTYFFTLCSLFLVLPAFSQGNAGTDDDGFVVIINAPASIAKTIPHRSNADAGECYWTGSTYGPSLLSDLCGEVVWAYDQTPDSLACDPIPGDLTGKIALIRRGVCGFSLKVYRAQQAGAIAVIMLNHFANAADGDCINYVPTGQQFGGMSGLDSAAAVKIPSVFLQRETGTQISDALKAGQKVNVCFNLPRMTNPTIAYQYATPLSQVDSLGAITVTFANRGTAVATNVLLKCDIKAPNGVLQSVTVPIAKMEPGQDTFAIFPPILPAKVKGKFEAVFSNNIFKTSRDTVRRFFEHTDYTFATDNLVIDPFGVGLTNQQFADAGFFTQNAGLSWTGPQGGKATYATFGLSNVDSLYVPGNAEANQILITLYDADADGDGVGDMAAGSAGASFNDLANGIVGTAVYEMKGNEAVDQIISVPLTDVTSGAEIIDLKPNHPYYISLTYDGTLAGTSRCLRFSNSLDEEYLVVGGLLATPLYTNLDGGTLYSGWAGGKVIQRLELEGFTPISSTKTPQLDASKISITPNPAVDFVNVNLKLDEAGNVGVTMIDWAGRSVRSVVQRDFQNGTVQIDTKSLPSGTYLMWVRTGEGYRVEKVAVCH